MTDLPLDNPAARLHRIMSRFLSVDGSMRIMTLLQVEMDLEAKPYDIVFREIAHFIELLPKTHVAILALKDHNHELLLRWEQHFNECLPCILAPEQFAVNSVQGVFTETDLYSLETCADLLHRKAPEPTIDEDKLPGLIDLVRAAIDAIAGDEGLPPAARQLLISRLEQVQAALTHFRTTGYGGVEEALDKLTGTIFREPSVQKSEESMGWLRKVMSNISVLVKGTKEIESGIEAGIKMIEAIQQAAS